MIRRSGLVILLMLAFLTASVSFVLAHPYPAPHSHKLTKSDPKTGDTHKKSKEDVKNPSKQKPETKTSPEKGSPEPKQHAPSHSDSKPQAKI